MPGVSCSRARCVRPRCPRIVQTGNLMAGTRGSSPATPRWPATTPTWCPSRRSHSSWTATAACSTTWNAGCESVATPSWSPPKGRRGRHRGLHPVHRPELRHPQRAGQPLRQRLLRAACACRGACRDVWSHRDGRRPVAPAFRAHPDGAGRQQAQPGWTRTVICGCRSWKPPGSQCDSENDAPGR